jgi:hypothetical protein
MGDAKLFLVLAPWIRGETFAQSLILLLAIAWFQLLQALFANRRFPRRIAFAPAILAAALLNVAT